MPSNSKRSYEKVLVKNIPTKLLTVSAESITVPAGIAGTIVDVALQQKPVLNSTFTDTGCLGDTSLSVTSGVFTTEVAPKDDASLANGEFYVDYVAGVIHGKKATTGTSSTASYTTLTMLTATTGGVFSFDGSTGALKVIAADAPKYENSTDQTASIGRKHLSTGTYSTPIVVRSAALEASHLIKASAGNLDAYRIEIAPSASTGTYYIQFFNLGTLPPEGSAPDLLAPITVTHTTGTVSVKEKDFNDEPIFFSSGCYVVVSSTQFTKTIASAIMSINVQAS